MRITAKADYAVRAAVELAAAEKTLEILAETDALERIAEYGTRNVTFKDGRVVADRRITNRRTAADELANLPEQAEAS